MYIIIIHKRLSVLDVWEYIFIQYYFINRGMDFGRMIKKIIGDARVEIQLNRRWTRRKTRGRQNCIEHTCLKIGLRLRGSFIFQFIIMFNLSKVIFIFILSIICYQSKQNGVAIVILYFNDFFSPDNNTIIRAWVKNL